MSAPKVAIVTGASRGIGKGTALELGSAGYTIYVTGRLPANSESSKNKVSSLEEVANEVTKRGGKGIAVHCDHSNPKDVKRLFERIDREQNGRLDLLVNNVLSSTYWVFENAEKKFWEYNESPQDAYDIVNNVGLRNHFVCSSYAAKMMVKRKSGLIINISSAGLVNSMMGVLYGLSTVGLARMSSDMAHDLKGTGVHSIALMPGWINTEIILDHIKTNPDDPMNKHFGEKGQSVYYTGRALVYLLQHPELLEKHNGDAISTTEIGDEYKVVDVDGKFHRRLLDPQIQEVYRRVQQSQQRKCHLNNVNLGAAGATVYVTGRPNNSSESVKHKLSSLEEVVNEIAKRGGKAIAVYCDHSDPQEVKKLFEQIEKEQNGQLDILVNNVVSASYWYHENVAKKFWEYKEEPQESYDIVNNVALRNHFVCSAYAARMMVKRKSGVIVNISSAGIANTFFGPLAGITTVGLSRMSSDFYHDLKGTGVHSIALMPGWVKTEVVEQKILSNPKDPFYDAMMEHGHSIYYPGRALVYLLEHPDLLKRYDGESVSTTEIGEEYNVVDVDQKLHPDPLVQKYKAFIDQYNKVNKENSLE
ncbi:Dehydrogenase reductase SDR family member 1-like [Aphelenchoides bicaudatus]|nr:Dehydrogenase reductase SDR family member 1-like [Aphelenchoides bicaudatus]